MYGRSRLKSVGEGKGVLICMRPAVRARVMIGLPCPTVAGLGPEKRLPHAPIGYNVN